LGTHMEYHILVMFLDEYLRFLLSEFEEY